MQVRCASTPCGGGGVGRCDGAIQRGEQHGFALLLGHGFLKTLAPAETTMPCNIASCLHCCFCTPRFRHSMWDACTGRSPCSLSPSRWGRPHIVPHHQTELLKPRLGMTMTSMPSHCKDVTPALPAATGLQVLTMVGSVAAGAVLIAGLNANTAVRSV